MIHKALLVLLMSSITQTSLAAEKGSIMQPQAAVFVGNITFTSETELLKSLPQDDLNEILIVLSSYQQSQWYNKPITLYYMVFEDVINHFPFYPKFPNPAPDGRHVTDMVSFDFRGERGKWLEKLKLIIKQTDSKVSLTPLAQKFLTDNKEYIKTLIQRYSISLVSANEIPLLNDEKLAEQLLIIKQNLPIVLSTTPALAYNIGYNAFTNEKNHNLGLKLLKQIAQFTATSNFTKPYCQKASYELANFYFSNRFSPEAAEHPDEYDSLIISYLLLLLTQDSSSGATMSEYASFVNRLLQNLALNAPGEKDSITDSKNISVNFVNLISPIPKESLAEKNNELLNLLKLLRVKKGKS